MYVVLLESLSAWWPETILSAGALLALLLGVFRGHRTAVAGAWVTLAASAVALWDTPVLPPSGVFYGLIVCDPLSMAFRWLALGTVAIVLLLVMGSRESTASTHGEYAGLLLFVGLGLMLMAEANHLLMAYVAIELVSLTSYVLVGFLNDSRSAEASLKYLLFGALSSGIMLFGMSLLFGLTGSLSFPEILRSSQTLGQPMGQGLLVAVTLMFAGLAFKISMVPFHMWTPDAYEGAPLPVTALLSVGPKAAGLALVLRVMETFQPAWPMLVPMLLGLTILTMTWGNLAALVQSNVKRLLAYSTIGQVGYLLIGVVVNTSMGLHGVLLYLVAYLFMNLGAFTCVIAVVNETGNESLEAFRGLAGRSPVLSAACTVFLLSLAGIPPLLGFFGKFLLFGAAIEANALWLALTGVLNSAIALYYYVNIVRLMYFTPGQAAVAFRPVWALRLALGVCAAVTLGLGLFPGGLMELLQGVASISLL